MISTPLLLSELSVWRLSPALSCEGQQGIVYNKMFGRHVSVRHLAGELEQQSGREAVAT
jgi:hypothetical protein